MALKDLQPALIFQLKQCLKIILDTTISTEKILVPQVLDLQGLGTLKR